MAPRTQRAGGDAAIGREVCAAAQALARNVSRLRFGTPVTHVYNPLRYARSPHEAFITRFGASTKRVVFLGMNPGPFGMTQTGVPFGAVEPVRDWLQIDVKLRRPRNEHPKRPVLGLGCTRNEVSGERLWGGIRDHWKTPERFFADHFIVNYCPLVFLEESGRNRTPDKLPKAEQARLFEPCDRHMRRVISALEPEWVVSIGAFAEARALAALHGRDVKIGRILHPSPANPRAQRDWAGSARRELQELGVCTQRGPA
jgi:single-strand selective monofunctional uracil DNA glycosylase